MPQKIKVSFDQQLLRLKLAQLLPTRQIKPTTKKSAKYGQILSSVREVGVIEPIVVFPAQGSAGSYLILDGHLRVEVLKDLGRDEATCLVSGDDESFTYNTHVNPVNAIQGHFMIVKALDRGVSEERLAAALQVDVAKIRRQRDLLSGICPEAVALLKDRSIPAISLQHLKRVRAIRQIEIAELMIAANNYSTPYARALLAATPSDQLIAPETEKVSKLLKPEDAARMDNEIKLLKRELRLIEESYGRDMLNLVLARGYLTKLLKNDRVRRYLIAHHGELLAELEKVAGAQSFEAPTG